MQKYRRRRPVGSAALPGAPSEAFAGDQGAWVGLRASTVRHLGGKLARAEATSQCHQSIRYSHEPAPSDAGSGV